MGPRLAWRSADHVGGLRPSSDDLSDGKKLFYMQRATAVCCFTSGELWVADLDTGQRHRLLPDFLLQSYAISADGERVVFVAAGDAERSPVWVAAPNGRAPPRRLVDKDGLQAAFGADGDVIVAARKDQTNFIYRIKEDGSAPQTIAQASNLLSVSLDGRWVIAGCHRMGQWHTRLAAVRDRDLRVVRAVGNLREWPMAVARRVVPRREVPVSAIQQNLVCDSFAPGAVVPPIPPGGFRTAQEVRRCQVRGRSLSRRCSWGMTLRNTPSRELPRSATSTGFPCTDRFGRLPATARRALARPFLYPPRFLAYLCAGVQERPQNPRLHEQRRTTMATKRMYQAFVTGLIIIAPTIARAQKNVEMPQTAAVPETSQSGFLDLSTRNSNTVVGSWLER